MEGVKVPWPWRKGGEVCRMDRIENSCWYNDEVSIRVDHKVAIRLSGDEGSRRDGPHFLLTKYIATYSTGSMFHK